MKSTLQELEKKFGLEQAHIDKNEVVSTGSLTLDIAVGNGGLPMGRIVEAAGMESSGKSTTTLHIIAEAQKRFPDKLVALFDYENSFDEQYAIALGVNCEKDDDGNFKFLKIYQPQSQEQGYDMIIALVESGLVSVVVIDSHTAACPQKIIDGEMGDATIGLAARNNSKFLNKVKGLCNKHKVLLFAISQMRANIGGYGASDVTTGGNAWKFYSDIRLKFNKSVDKDNALNETTVTVIKNKCAAPFGVAKFNVEWGKGIDYLGELVDIAIDNKIVNKGGAWLTYGETKVQGKAKFKDLLRDNDDFKNEFETKVKECLKELL